MARIKIELPEQMVLVCRLQVRITDINYGGHAGNDRIVGFVHEARVQYFKQMGYDELDIEGVGTIMSDVAVEYKAELFQGDQLNVYMGAGDFTRIGFDLYYQLRKVSGQTETVAANAKTGMICYDYNLRKVASLPGKVRIRLENA